MSDPIMHQFQKLSMQRTFTFATREAGPPTWGQLKKLTQKAEKTLQKAGQPLNPTNLLLAMMAVVTCQSTGAGEKKKNEKKSFAYSSAYSASTRKERGRCRELGLKKVEKCLQTRLSPRGEHSCKRDVLPSV
ncbi:hypothetical protein CapIbe_012996, partial [Capra ibex]